MRALPFDEALAIVDSALRETDFTPEGVALLASTIKGRGAVTAQRVAMEATGKAANAFESVARTHRAGHPWPPRAGPVPGPGQRLAHHSSGSR
jgi:hypothetical protein